MALRARQRLLLAVTTFFTAVYYLFVLNLHSMAASEETAADEEGRQLWSRVETSAPRPGNPNLSSVDYMACCGAGHRMSKLSEANYLSKLLKFELRSFWGYCDHGNYQTEVFHYLFGPQPTVHNSTSQNLFARINNDVPNFRKLSRDGTATCELQCDSKKAATDVEFYRDLRRRFRWRLKVDAFREQHFANELVIGIHIRAGNGETGDFADRKRGIPDLDNWINSLAGQIKDRVNSEWNNKQKATVLFLATDTPSIVQRLQTVLGSNLPIVVWEQPRPKAGAGVMFGEQGKVIRNGEQCLQGWANAFMDMMLLSYANILIAARPSSFTQSLPMSLVYAQDDSKATSTKQFCEVNSDATDMRCYQNFEDWCCNGITDFSLQGIQRYDYLRMPDKDKLGAALDSMDSDVRKRFKISDRPAEGCIPRPEGWKQLCLPYDWSEFVVKPRKQPKGLV